MRYKDQSRKKAKGETFTPIALANFVAERLLSIKNAKDQKLRILEPSVGDGSLLIALIKKLKLNLDNVSVIAYDINEDSLNKAKNNLFNSFPTINAKFEKKDFLEEVFIPHLQGNKLSIEKFDLIIANPPYVRTQALNENFVKRYAEKLNLQGRIDLYQAFVVAMVSLLKEEGCLGAIISNRFLTTKSGFSLREFLKNNIQLKEIWDLGDTKLFNEAVLPALIFCENSNSASKKIIFNSIYETSQKVHSQNMNIFDALSSSKISSFKTSHGKAYQISRGHLDKELLTTQKPWTWTNQTRDTWINKVKKNTFMHFSDVSKIKVGVKTTADKVFISSDWDKLGNEKPELIYPLLTRKNISRYSFNDKKVPKNQKYILYPYEMNSDSRKTIQLDNFPKTKEYLNSYKTNLYSRKYLIDSGKEWFEIWVPHIPKKWKDLKLVFTDISEKPNFCLDKSGSIVNGDCYWLSLNQEISSEMYYLMLGIANSRFIETFYDYSFPNKLYSGKRRFMSQYVENFPLPNPSHDLSKFLIEKVKKRCDCKEENEQICLEIEIENIVTKLFFMD